MKTTFLPGAVAAPGKLTRTCAASLKLRSFDAAHLEFETVAPRESFGSVSSADPGMNESPENRCPVVRGRIRFDFFADGDVRVRYAEGNTLPENTLPMIQKFPEFSTRAARYIEGEAGCAWENGDLRFVADHATGELKFYRSGRLLITIGGTEKNYFGHWDAFNTGLCTVGESGERFAVEKFSLSPADAVYGFGESFGRLDKNGQTIDLDIQDALGVTTPRCYKAVPFCCSTQGYGVFFNTSGRMRFDIGARSRCDLQVAVDDDHLDYFLFFGTVKEVLLRYTELTGRPPLPPEWSFGFWQSKISYRSAEEICEITRKLHEEGFPCDVIHLDTHWFRHDWLCDLEFDPVRFDPRKKWREELRSRGVRLSVWQLPYIPSGSRLFARLKEAGGFVKDRNGKSYDCGICFARDFGGGEVCIVDYTNPAAIEIMDEELGRLMTVNGVDVVKTDFGEGIPDDACFHNGMSGRQMHNLYPFYYNKAVFEITKKHTGRGIVWGRSAWAGNQRFPLCWGGDNSGNFDNMLPQLGGGLSLGLSGFPFWSQDIGGFLGKMGGKLLVRWLQLGCFLSHCRIHGYGDRELYKEPEPVRSLCRAALQLRYSLMPYLLSEAEKAAEEGLPILRALVIEFQDDRTTWAISDEFLWGSGFLVAPLFTESDERDVYFPAGRWVDYFTREEYSGPCWRRLTCPEEHTLLFVREGAVIPYTRWACTVEETMKNPRSFLVCRRTTPGETIRDECVYRFDGRSHTVTVSGVRMTPKTEHLELV